MPTPNKTQLGKRLSTLFGRWFTPPNFPGDEAKTRRTALLNIALTISITILPFTLISNLLGGNTPPIVFGLNLLYLILCLLLRFWVHHGKITRVSFIYIALVYVYLTSAIANLGTVRSPTTAIYILWVMAAGIFFDRLGLGIAFGLSALATAGLISAENFHLLPHADFSVTVTQWTIYSLTFGAAGGLMYWTLQELRQVLARADQEIAERKRAEGLVRVQRDLSAALASAITFEAMLGHVLDATLEIQGLDAGGIYLVDARTGALNLNVHRGLSAKFVQRAQYFAADTPQTRLVMAGQPFYSTNSELAASMHTEQVGEQLRALCVLPIRHEDRVIAALNLASHTHDVIGISARPVLESLAAQMGGVIARIQAEQALQDSQRKLQTLFDTVDDLIMIVDPQGKILHVNPAVLQRLQLEPTDIADIHISDLHPPEQHAQAQAIIAAMLAGNATACNIPLVAKNGTRIPVETKVQLGKWDGQTVLFGISRDITERQRLESELQEQRDFALMVLNTMGEGLTVADATGRFVLVNPAYGQMVGYAPQDLIGKSPHDVTVVEDRTALNQAWVERTRRKTTTYETRFRHADGTVIYAQITGTPRWHNGEFAGTVAVITDLTKSKRVEAQLRASEQLYHQMFDHHSAIKLLIDPASGAIVDANQAAIEFYGYPLGILRQMSMYQISGLAPEELAREHQAALTREKDYFIQAHRLATGELRDVESYLVPIETQDRIVLYSIIHDITARRQAESQLRYLGTHDALTGLYNRAFFESEMVRYEPSRNFPISLIIADADNLKVTNDTRGHTVGDEMIQHIAAALQAACRASDIVARIGGDEFAILLPNTEATTARQIVLRIQQKLDDARRNRPDLPLEISIGVATAAQKKLEDTFRLADARMYADKRAHKQKNCVPQSALARRA